MDKEREGVRSAPPEREQPPPWRVLLHFGEERRPVSFPARERLTFGRSNDDPGLPQPGADLTPFGAVDLGVSRMHAALVFRENTLYLEDLGSTNGTRINGKTIDPNTLYRLRNDDEIELGRLRFTVRLIRPPA